MSALMIASYGAQVLSALPGLIRSGIEVTALVQQQSQKMNEMIQADRAPTPEEWNELGATIDRLRRELHEDPNQPELDLSNAKTPPEGDVWVGDRPPGTGDGEASR